MADMALYRSSDSNDSVCRRGGIYHVLHTLSVRSATVTAGRIVTSDRTSRQRRTSPDKRLDKHG
jgi:hypothetical protein